MQAQLDNAPEFDIKDIPELKDFVPGKPIRGFAVFKEHINKNGRPKSNDPKVGISVRIPLSAANRLRSSGPGWQTRISNYLIKGINEGEVEKISVVT